MAREPLTLDEIRAHGALVDKARIAATTEEDIHRHQIEDGARLPMALDAKHDAFVGPLHARITGIISADFTSGWNYSLGNSSPMAR